LGRVVLQIGERIYWQSDSHVGWCTKLTRYWSLFEGPGMIAGRERLKLDSAAAEFLKGTQITPIGTFPEKRAVTSRFRPRSGESPKQHAIRAKHDWAKGGDRSGEIGWSPQKWRTSPTVRMEKSLFVHGGKLPFNSNLRPPRDHSATRHHKRHCPKRINQRGG